MLLQALLQSIPLDEHFVFVTFADYLTVQNVESENLNLRTAFVQ